MKGLRQISLLMLLSLFISTTLLTGCGDADIDVKTKDDGTEEATGTDVDNSTDTDVTEDASDLYVESIKLFRDSNGDPGEEVTGFAPSDQAFHAVAYVNKMNTGLKAKGELFAVETEGGSQSVASVEEEFGINNQVDFTFTLPRDWPKGKYRVDVTVENNEPKSIEFMIQ